MSLRCIKVVIADAAHLLDPSHSPRTVFLGLDETAARALDANADLLSAVPAARHAPRSTDARDEEITRMRAQLDELTALNKQLAAGVGDGSLLSQLRALQSTVASLQGAAPAPVTYKGSPDAAGAPPAAAVVETAAPAPAAPDLGAPPVAVP